MVYKIRNFDDKEGCRPIVIEILRVSFRYCALLINPNFKNQIV